MATSKRNLMTASRQWAERPADERFWTLEDLLLQTRAYAYESRVKTVALSKCTALGGGSPEREV